MSFTDDIMRELGQIMDSFNRSGRQWGGYFYYDDSYPNDDCKVWAPSTDIAHAWEVAARWCTPESRLTIQWDPIDQLFRVWVNAREGRSLPAESTSLPHAICLVALRAVGVDVDA